MVELLKCEKTFLLKINSNTSHANFMDSTYQNKSVIRFQYKSENGNFSSLLPMIKTISNYNYIKIRGNPLLPIISSNIIKNLIDQLSQRKIKYFKISKVTLDNCAFNIIAKFIKINTPIIMIFDINCISNKANHFQNYLAKLWKNK